MENKKAVAGEGIMMIYRLLLISFIALVILGLAAVFYDYSINVRWAEAQILGKKVVNCLAPEGVLDLNKIPSSNENSILDYCGISNNKRFFVQIDVMDSNMKSVKTLQHGDTGTLWVKRVYDTGKVNDNIKKYEPGYFSQLYDISTLSNTNKIGIKVNLKVLVNYEDQ